MNGDIEGVAKVEDLEMLEVALEEAGLPKIMGVIRGKNLSYREVLGYSEEDVGRVLEIEDVAVRERIVRVTAGLREQARKRGATRATRRTRSGCCVIL